MHATETQKLETREERGLRIAALVKLHKNDSGWEVPSLNGSGAYVVNPQNGTCTCPDHTRRGVKCKHLWAVEYAIIRETKKDGTTKITHTTRVTYSQEWTAYNAAQMNEERLFGPLLQSLCSGIAQTEQTFGRPRLPLSDVVFALVSKVYSGIIYLTRL